MEELDLIVTEFFKTTEEFISKYKAGEKYE